MCMCIMCVCMYYCIVEALCLGLIELCVCGQCVYVYYCSLCVCILLCIGPYCDAWRQLWQLCVIIVLYYYYMYVCVLL